MSEKPLRIAMVGQKRIPSREGGVEIVVEELATRMAARGHDVTCYNRAGAHVSGAEFGRTRAAQIREYKGVHLKTVPTVDRRGLAAVTASCSASVLTLLHACDIVHYHAEGPCAMLWIPKLFGKRCVATIHGLDWQRAKWGGFASRYIRFGEWVAAHLADELIVLSGGVQEYFRKTYGRETVLIPNGVNQPTLRPAREITEHFGLHKDEYCLFLGRIVPEKGVHYLLEAWKGVRTEKKLVIAGGSSDTDDYYCQLKNQYAENAVFTGFVQGELLDELYSNAYLYCLPSDLEGMPLSLLEAMSYGNCCLVSSISECTDVVGTHAAVFQKGDVGDLRDKLQGLLDQPELAASYRRGAAAYILRRFNWEDVVEKTLGLYTNNASIPSGKIGTAERQR